MRPTSQRPGRPARSVGLPCAALLGPASLAHAAAAPPAAPGAAAPGAAVPARKVSPYRSVGETANARAYYRSVWGLDKLKVSSTSSGNLIRFSYRVVEPK